MKDFFAELKRRNVYKVAVAYAVVAWLLLQGASIVLPSFDAPVWTMKVLILVLAVGFPVAVVLAWAFEITPEGIVRADEVDPDKSITRRTGRRLTAIIILIAILAAGLFVFQKSRQSAGNAPKTVALSTVPSPHEKSVAVLPFNDLSAAHDQEYFGDGLAEELLNVLVQVDGLSVVSRTSSFAFKGKNLSVPAIAQALGVAHIVEGSVRRIDNRVRVTAQLIDVATDRHLWSQSFDRETTDIFVIQADIARSIAEALKVRLGKAGAINPGTGNVAAYDLYLLGLYHWNQRTEEGLLKALDLFREATQVDPSFARAFAGLSMTYVLIPGYAPFDRDLAAREGRIAALKAVELDPQSAEGLTALAQTFKLTEALEIFDRAIASNPRFATARHWKGITLTSMGRLKEGEAELRIARSLDPGSLPIQSYLGLNLAYQSRFVEALTEAVDLLKRAPDYRNGLHQAFVHGAMLGRARENVGFLERYFRVIGEDPTMASRIVDALDVPAKRAEAIAGLNAIAPRHQKAGEQNQVAQLYALLKAETETLELLGNHDFPLYPPWPIYDFLRGNPRYEALLAESKQRLEAGPAVPEKTKP